MKKKVFNKSSVFNCYITSVATFFLLLFADCSMAQTSGTNVVIGSGVGSPSDPNGANVVIGNQAGYHITTGKYNMLLGNSTGTGITTSNGNAFIGDGSGYNLSSGDNNVGIGRYAGINLTAGSNNVFLGLAAGPSTGSGSLSNAIAIGTNAFVGASNSMVLGGTGSNAINVGIGVTAPTYRLTVNGVIGAREVNVTSEQWADFVFDRSYKLPPLQVVERAIQQYKHLPGIPSACEVENHGVNLGQMQVKLLQKIEELTLYVIQQQKQILRLEKKLGVSKQSTPWQKK